MKPNCGIAALVGLTFWAGVARGFNLPDEAWFQASSGSFYLLFNWKNIQPDFPADVVAEFQVTVDDVCFAAPIGGKDTSLEFDGHVSTNLDDPREELDAYVDVWNYNTPSTWLEAYSQAAGCGYASVGAVGSAFFASRIPNPDDYGNFAVGVRHPENLRKGVPYWIRYGLSNALKDLQSQCEAVASFSSASVAIQTIRDTCTHRSTRLRSDCPYLLGAQECAESDEEAGRLASLVDAVCLPTKMIAIPNSIDRGAGGFCRDQDDDDWFDAASGALGTGVGDCDDSMDAVKPDASEDCHNGIDDNCNDLVDCNDAQCADHSECSFCPGARACATLECGRDPVCDVPCGSCDTQYECVDGRCVARTQAATCSDGVQDQGESGVDCGGPCPDCQASCSSGNGDYCGDGVSGRNPDHLYVCRDGEYDLVSDCSGNGCTRNDPGIDDECTPPEDACTAESCPDDGNACNGVEHCVDGTCVSDSPPDCGAGQICDSTLGCRCVDGTEEDCSYAGEPPSTQGVGTCRAGRRRCEGGAWTDCLGAVFPVAEVCGDGEDNDCDGETDCADVDCSSAPDCADGTGGGGYGGAAGSAGAAVSEEQGGSAGASLQNAMPTLTVDEAIERLQACSSSAPTTTRVFATALASERLGETPRDFALAGCFIADNAEDGAVPEASSERAAFLSAVFSANDSLVLGRTSPFVDVSISLANSKGYPDSAFVTCPRTSERLLTWYGHNYLLSPVTAAGRDAIVELAGEQAHAAVHPVLYVDSLLAHLWYHAQFANPEDCFIDVAGEGGEESGPDGRITESDWKLDIDADGHGDSLNDPRWLSSQQAALEAIRSSCGVAIVGHATEASSACQFAPYLDGVDTELGGYVADADRSRHNESRSPITHLEAWEQQTRRCRNGQSCYRGVFTSADPALDAQIEEDQSLWYRTDLWDLGGVIQQMRDDQPRIHSAHILAALTGASALPGTTYWWSIGPFPSDWIDASSDQHFGWLGQPLASGWQTVESTSGTRIDLREYANGVVLWNDIEATVEIDMTGWLGSSLNPVDTNAFLDGEPVTVVVLAARSGAALLQPADVPTLPRSWLDSRITQSMPSPGEEDAPLRVTVHYEPSPDVATVVSMSGWTNGNRYGPWTDDCHLEGPEGYSCSAVVGCVLTELQVYILVDPPAEGQSGACYRHGANGSFGKRGRAWVETNHGQSVELDCVDSGAADGWGANLGLPDGILLL